MIDSSAYILKDTQKLVSPALIYYKDIILANTQRTIAMAGRAERLWPHIKSHKSREMLRMQISQGITRFKCATIAEAEAAAAAGDSHVILAYPLVPPNTERFLRLAGDYTQTVFYAIGDNYEQLKLLASLSEKMGTKANLLIDVDMGMQRTGVPIENLEKFYEQCAGLKGIALNGMHCYDGHISDSDFAARKSRVDEIDEKIFTIRQSLVQKGCNADIMVMGGTPTFPCRTEKEGLYLSPGTCFIGDWGYYKKLPDMPFTPGAALLSRVVSHPTENTFTLDLGYKGVASDPAGERGIIAGMEDAKPLFQSEEHWVFSMPQESALPPIGSDCYIIPTHICPTSALYPEILIAQGNTIVEQWQVDARNRKINY
jgi:D-serine deaminase-like pyridoxal phosphate-dependent protein